MLFRSDLVIGFKMFRERFTSEVKLQRPHRLDVTYIEGPMKRLSNHWQFAPAPGGGTEISFYVDFEFRSKVLQSLIGVLFNEAVRRMVAAFETRARAQYGGASEVGPGSSSGAAQTGLGG